MGALVSLALHLSEPLFVFDEVEASTVDAIVSRIFPTDDRNGGAHEAEVVVYIDRTLAGYSRHLQSFYRDHLRQLDTWCVTHFGASFASLTEQAQEEALALLDTHGPAFGEQGKLSPVELAVSDSVQSTAIAPLRVFFDVIWEHTMQGMFCDPAYGGNKDVIGWRVLGFPGAQWKYTAEQRAQGFDAKSIPIRTVTDLQRERPWETLFGRATGSEDVEDAAAT